MILIIITKPTTILNTINIKDLGVTHAWMSTSAAAIDGAGWATAVMSGHDNH